MYPENSPPIEITSKNMTHVHFRVKNTWNTTLKYFYTEYHQGNFGDTECLEEENVQSHVAIEEYVATCMHNVPISIVNVWVVDSNGSWFDEMDVAEVPECCYPPKFSRVPTVQYTFKLSCDPSYCPPATRRLAVEENHVSKVDQIPVEVSSYSNTGEKFDESRLQSAEENENDKASLSRISNPPERFADAKDGHFCVSEDYPCGESNDHVHVCHYSARDGYKTFCVPESDSDVLAFYKKDYCGPCIGGYGGKVNRKKRTWL